MSYQFLNFETLGSTSSYIKDNYLSLPDRTVVAALRQSDGHGRLGRKWLSEEGALTFSLLLKGESYGKEIALLPFGVGEAVGLCFEQLGAKPMLKWPNDVYLNGKKAAGILVEGLYEGSVFLGAVIGIGINLNQASFPEDLPNATSLFLETNKRAEPGLVVRQVLEALERRLLTPSLSLPYFRLHDYLFGKEVSLDYYGENLIGTAKGVDEKGRLLLQKANGAIETVSSGEATLSPQEYKLKGNNMNPIDLSRYGIVDAKEVIYNPSYEFLYEEENRPELEGYEKGQATELGAMNVMTGIYTGRSPKDKYLVVDEKSKDTVWWNSPSYPNDNHPMSIETWKEVRRLAVNELSNKRLFVVDAYCGANKDTRMAVRFIVEVAWQAHFIKNMFIRPSEEELKTFEPDFVVYNASKAKVANYKELGLNSETCVAFNITSKEQVILNTWYGGEMKKGMFSMMNYFLPLKGMASMHCSANTDMNGENTAIFFGLSGTGKTTLSTDPKRLLIGDDEHGWDDNGVFNFEGGCYAKVINLDKDSEPDIYNAIKKDALLENVTVKENGKIDFADKSVTENTRVSYPIYHIEKIVKPISHGPAAKNVIFLSADAFGVLPPVSILTPEQTQYYFLSGFTAKLAGTERGITTPTPTFSACFGQAFLELHPTKYAEELVKKMQKSGAKAYLVNTGWNGTGKRISIKDTRGIIDAILDGSISKAPTKKIPYFDFEVPTSLPGVDPAILDPRDTYAKAGEWESKAKDLASRFIKNFVKYEDNEKGKALVSAGPHLD